MKTQPNVYRVNVGESFFEEKGYVLERLHLWGPFASWRLVKFWPDKPTHEAVATAIEGDTKEQLQAAERDRFEPYFVTPEAAA